MKTVFDDLGREPTPVEIIDYVEAHLNKQKGRSRKIYIGIDYEHDRCAYRSPEGKSCAVGCLIDDETANTWDNKSNASLYNIDIPEDHWMHKYKDLLSDLQCAHDNSLNWNNEGTFVNPGIIKTIRNYHENRI